MTSASLRSMLLGIALLLFAICFALSSTGMGLITLGIAVVGLAMAFNGFVRGG